MQAQDATEDEKKKAFGLNPVFGGCSTEKMKPELEYEEELTRRVNSKMAINGKRRWGKVWREKTIYVGRKRKLVKKVSE